MQGAGAFAPTPFHIHASTFMALFRQSLVRIWTCLQGDTISLANALWGFPAAPGCASQDAHAPDSWQRAFATQPGAAAVFQCLFGSCKAGQEWALVTAPSATLRIDCRPARLQQELSAQLAAAKQCLAVRGGRPTSVELQCDDSDRTQAVLEALSQSFQGAGTGGGSHVVGLVLTTWDGLYSVRVSAFVSTTVPVLFPNLTSLTLTGCAYPLPPPAQLPHLSVVTVDWGHFFDQQAYVAIPTSVAAYLPQLHSLDYGLYMGRRWDQLFSPATHSHTLKVFKSSHTLTDTLLTLLLSHAPALEQLSVLALHQDISDHSKQQWAVGRLNVLDLVRGRRTASAPALMRLPRLANGGRVAVYSECVDGTLTMTAQVCTGLAFTPSRAIRFCHCTGKC